MILLEINNSKSGIRPANLFFIELLIVLLFFSFSVAVILQIFAAAEHRQELSDLTEGSVICAQSVAEAFSVSGSLPDTLDTVFGDDDYSEEKETLILDGNFEIAEEGNVTLALGKTEKETAAGVLAQLDMKFMLGERELYSLSCTSYTSVNGGGGNE